MTNRDQSSGIERRAFLGAAAAGVASAAAPRATLAQAPARSCTSGAAGSHHGADERAFGRQRGQLCLRREGRASRVFSTGTRATIWRRRRAGLQGAAGFPAYGKPGLRREADFIFERMGQNLRTLGTDFAHSVRLDQYYTQANAVRAYHLARFAALGKYVPPSTSIITDRCFGSKSTMTTSLIAVTPEPHGSFNRLSAGARVSPTRAMRPPCGERFRL